MSEFRLTESCFKEDAKRKFFLPQTLSANFTIPIMLKTAIINSFFLLWRNVDVTFLFITNLQFTFKLLQRKCYQDRTLETNKNANSRIHIDYI